MYIFFGFVVDVLVGGAVLYWAAKVVSVDLEFKETVIAAGSAAILALINFGLMSAFAN